MRDLHSHFLPSVDDGSKSIEQTKNMLQNAKDNGVTDIIFTPHYILDSKYQNNKKKNEEIFEPIKKIAQEEYGINVFLGNEVYCNSEMLRLYNEGEIATLNNSRYMLIEIPMYSKMNNVKSLFFELISNGIIPVLAHPERYTAYYKDYEFFKELTEMGVLLQVNFPSITGLYGRKAKVMSTKLLKMGLISLVGSDIHRETEGKYELIEKANKKLIKLVGKEKFIDITMNNFARIVTNQEIK